MHVAYPWCYLQEHYHFLWYPKMHAVFDFSGNSKRRLVNHVDVQRLIRWQLSTTLMKSISSCAFDRSKIMFSSMLHISLHCQFVETFSFLTKRGWNKSTIFPSSFMALTPWICWLYVESIKYDSELLVCMAGPSISKSFSSSISFFSHFS